MTEFRTKGKGKERQVYPVKKKQVFGVTRNLAYEDVLSLRSQGKRARLIQTNKRLDLYAPYESVISIENNPDTQANPDINQKPKPETPPVTINEVDKAIKELEANLPPKDFAPPAVYSKDGKTFVVSVDNAHVMMLYGSINGTISREQNPVGPKLRIPVLDYGDSNSGSIFLDQEQQKIFLKDLRSSKEANDVVLYKPSGSYDTYMFIRSENRETKELYLSGKPLKFMNRNGTTEELLVHLPPDYVKRALKTLSSINKANNNAKGSMSIRFRSDYPMEITSGKSDMEFSALIAPRIPDKEWNSKELLSAKLKEEIKEMSA